jgi:hypothetical protein
MRFWAVSCACGKVLGLLLQAPLSTTLSSQIAETAELNDNWVAVGARQTGTAFENRQAKTCGAILDKKGSRMWWF